MKQTEINDLKDELAACRDYASHLWSELKSLEKFTSEVVEECVKAYDS